MMLNETGNGTICIPKWTLPADLGIVDGQDASLQVITVGDSGTALYNVFPSLLSSPLLCSMMKKITVCDDELTFVAFSAPTSASAPTPRYCRAVYARIPLVSIYTRWFNSRRTDLYRVRRRSL